MSDLEPFDLFVDDERPAPPFWTLAVNSREAILTLAMAQAQGRFFNEVSLDHDLGGDDTSRPVVVWMCENDFWPANAYVHTGNPIGEEWLTGMITRYAPPGTLRGWGLNFHGTGPDTRVQNWAKS